MKQKKIQQKKEQINNNTSQTSITKITDIKRDFVTLNSLSKRKRKQNETKQKQKNIIITNENAANEQRKCGQNKITTNNKSTAKNTIIMNNESAAY